MTPLTREQVEKFKTLAAGIEKDGIVIQLCEDWLKMRAALDDFVEHGFRADCNPTGMFHDCGHFTLMHQNWQDYLKSIDSSVRERARQALGRDGG